MIFIGSYSLKEKLPQQCVRLRHSRLYLGDRSVKFSYSRSYFDFVKEEVMCTGWHTLFEKEIETDIFQFFIFVVEGIENDFHYFIFKREDIQNVFDYKVYDSNKKLHFYFRVKKDGKPVELREIEKDMSVFYNNWDRFIMTEAATPVDIDINEHVPTNAPFQINVNDFINFVRSRQGQVIRTRKQNKEFTVEVTNKGFEFTPTATQKRRPHELEAIKRVVAKFNETGSYTTSLYTDITYNSSYTLTLIGLYLDFAPTADADELDKKVHNIRNTISTADHPEGQKQPQKISSTTSLYVRDPSVKAWVLENAKGDCENCGSPAPFLNSYDEPFLEVHHVVLLAEGGADTICNTIAVCPNCHRRYHYSKNKLSDLKELYIRIPRLRRM